jgi:hypothetical protein
MGKISSILPFEGSFFTFGEYGKNFGLKLSFFG